jgi:hypothetical protein
MFLDTSFNALQTVLANVYQSFLDSAQRCAEYIRELAVSRRPNSRLLISTCSPNHPESRFSSGDGGLAGALLAVLSLSIQPPAAANCSPAETIEHLVALAAVLLQRPSRKASSRCVVGRRQVHW